MNQPAYRDVLPEGYKLHWYTINSVLGRGGSGVTYLAHDNNLDNLVAIKEYFPVDYSFREEGFSVHATESPNHDMYYWGLERFIKEARILAKFKYHHIVRVLSVFEQNNTAYMVMEYEQGKPLSKHFKENPKFSQDQLLKIFVPILDSLSLVHKAGFIHRDIKPSNIYIRSDGSPILIDFGAARRVMGSAATQQLTSIVTYGYAPFEQYNEGDEKQGPWTDIYALGACLYVAVTGSPPVDAMSRGTAMLSKGIDPYQAASVVAADQYSTDFLRAIDRALMFYAEDRPKDTREWTDMLTGKTEAPALPEDMLQPADDEKKTVMMPYPPSGRRSGILSAAPSPRTAPVEHAGKRTAAKFITPIALVLVLAIGTAVFLAYQTPETLEQAQTPVQPEPEPQPEPETLAESQLQPPPQPDLAKRMQEREKQRVDDLFAQADSAATMGRQIAPATDSAVFFYQRILEVDPSNQLASVKIEEILDRHIEEVGQRLAKGEFDDAELIIQQLSAVAEDAEKVINLANALASARVTDLIARAEHAFVEKRLTKPQDNNALSLFRQVLDIEPDNAAAKQGIAKIAGYFERQARNNIQQGNISRTGQYLDTLATIDPTISSLDQLRSEMERKKKIKERLQQEFEQHLKANEPKAAESVVRSVEQTFPGSSLARDLRAKLARITPPDIELISETLSRFKSAFETRNIAGLKAISPLDSDKVNFLNQFFDHYRSFKIEVTNFQYIGKERRASAEILLTDLIDRQGDAVQAGAWSHFSIKVKRNASGEWKVYW